MERIVISNSPKLRTFDDRTLLQLAVEPARPLFPLLRNAGAMTPLVVLLAFLPAIYAFENRTWTDLGSRWGLQSLQRRAARDLNEFVDPGHVDPATPYKWQPPLMGCMNAFCLRIWKPSIEASLGVTACLCTAGLIAAAYALSRRLGGERLGLLTSLLLAANPEVLKMAQEPFPHAASLMFSVLCLWGVVAHWQESTEFVSLRLLFAGIALGLCLLAGGPMVFGVLAALVLHILWRKFAAHRGSRDNSGQTDPSFRIWNELGTLGVVAATAFALSGWWNLMMSSRYGVEFWRAWFSWTSPLSPREPLEFVTVGLTSIAEQLNLWMLPLISLSLLAGFRIVQDNCRGDRADGQHRFLLLAWMFAGIVIWSGIQRVFAFDRLAEGAWQPFVVLPLVMLAAIGMLEIVERRVSFQVALATLLVACAEIPWMAERAYQHVNSAPYQTPAWPVILTTVGVLGILAAGLVWIARGHAVREWRILMLLMLLVLTTTFARGAWCVRRTTSDDRALVALRTALLRIQGVRNCTLVSAQAALPNPSDSLPPVMYLVRSIWPDARVSQASSWEMAVAQVSSAATGDQGAQVVVAWGIKGQPSLPGASFVMKPIGPLYHFRGFEIAAYEPVGSFP